MAYGSISLEKRLKDNIKNYSLSSILDTNRMSDQLEILHKLSGVEVLVTDRHGEKMISYGNFASFRPDVVNDPGVKLRVADRTVAHIYLRYDQVEEDKLPLVSTFLDKLIETYESVGMQTYYHKETAVYADELEAKLEVYSHLAQAMDDIKLGRVQSADDVFAELFTELKKLEL